MSTLQTLTNDVVELIAQASAGQKEAVLQVGRKVQEYVLLYSEKVTEPALVAKARTKAVRVLSEDVAKQAPANSFDLHRAFQILGVTQVYGEAANTWSFSVLKEIAPTIRFDTCWITKEGIDADKIRALGATLGTAPTVSTARTEVTKLLGDLRRRSPKANAAKPLPATPPQPPKGLPPADKPKGEWQGERMPKVVVNPPPATPAAPKDPDPEPAKLAGEKSAPATSQKNNINAAVESEAIAHEVLQKLRYDTPDKIRALKWIAKNLDNDEIVALVQGFGQFEGSWAALRTACKNEHAARSPK